MIYLMHGGDEFSLQETLNKMREEVGPPELREINATVLDGREIGLGKLISTAGTAPFLANKRMVVVKGLLAKFESRRTKRRTENRNTSSREPNLGEWQDLPKRLSDLPETTDLVFVDGSLTRNNSLLVKIRSIAKVLVFPLPTGYELRRWIQERATVHGLEIEPRAVNSLADSIGNNLRMIDSELRKLSLYRLHKPISHQDIQEMVSYIKDANIFAAVDAIIEGQPSVAIRLTHQLLESGRSPGNLVGMIARQIRFLLVAKDLKEQGISSNEVGNRLSLSGYPLSKTLEQESKLTMQRLRDTHRRLLETDVRIKIEGFDEQLALDVLISEIAFDF